MHKSLEMRKILLLFLFVTIFISMSTAQTPAYETITINGQTYYKYTVKQGEGLFAISRTFNVSVNDILKHNPSASAELKNGQELLIPINQSTQPPAPVTQPSQQLSIDQNHTFRHTITRGETLFGIAQMYNTNIDEIIQYSWTYSGRG
ncbi:MAG: membrane-bound lytic murein transglycosylase D [Bacteroidetes bacterium ADurb.BinA174]|nr:MAG: membrane-bound lytic murein transglycosylase D [Bacteroidetes bacterium ADurb.BinA174]